MFSSPILLAFRRLLFITFIFLFSFSLSLFFLRRFGLKKNPPPLSPVQDFFLKEKFIVLKGGRGDLAPPYSEEAISLTLKASSLIPALNLYFDSELSKWRIGLPSLKNPNLISQESRPFRFEEFLPLLSKEHPLFLKLHSHSPQALDSFLENIASKSPPYSLILESLSSRSLKLLKQKKSHLMLVSHPSNLTQFFLMKALFIETLYNKNESLFLFSEKISPSFRMLKEIKRRNKKSILKIKNFQAWKKFPFKTLLDGVLIEDPKAFLFSCSFSQLSLSFEKLFSSCLNTK